MYSGVSMWDPSTGAPVAPFFDGHWVILSSEEHPVVRACSPIWVTPSPPTTRVAPSSKRRSLLPCGILDGEEASLFLNWRLDYLVLPFCSLDFPSVQGACVLLRPDCCSSILLQEKRLARGPLLAMLVVGLS
jgi:hypothetical protein